MNFREYDRIPLYFLLGLLLFGCLQAQEKSLNPAPDSRFKSDVMLILAHPDDETAIGSYLAKLVFDDRKTVSAVYLNRGGGGGNSIGYEQSTALASIREVEMRQALAKFGIFKVWILGGKDTPGQDLFHSLENAGHGMALEQTVRLIRLTRPEVIITWMPVFVSGENHGDHQAAGVIATEAFDLAGDPTIFPTQVAVPRDRQDIENHQEGLRPWQVKKIYYFSDRELPLEGPGPAFDISGISNSRGIPYCQLAAELHTPHMVQGEVAAVGLEALTSGDFSDFIRWLGKYRLIFGKSHVPCKPAGDVFEGITGKPHPFVRSAGFKPDKRSGIYLETGGVLAFYRQFWQAHQLEHLADLVEHEIMIAWGSYLHFPLLIGNKTDRKVQVNLTCHTPEGWQQYIGMKTYNIEAGEVVPAQTMLQAPWLTEPVQHGLKWFIELENNLVDSVQLNVDLREWTLPQ